MPRRFNTKSKFKRKPSTVKRDVELVLNVRGYFDYDVYCRKTGVHLGWCENGVFYRDQYGRNAVGKVSDIYNVVRLDTTAFDNYA